MGYFSNGCEGSDYRATYCERCVHILPELEPDPSYCTVWNAHLLYCYGGSDEQQELLDILIPRRGVTNLQCSMFLPLDEQRLAQLREEA